MYKIELKIKSILYLEVFFRRYREYYQNLYEDTGLWNEEQIISWYNLESKTRKQEILNLIEEIISDENILWKTLENTIFIRWRTKYIFIKWVEKKNIKTRYITNIEIR